MANLEEEITNLKANLQRQEDIIEQRLRVVRVPGFEPFVSSLAASKRVAVLLLFKYAISCCLPE